MSTSPTARANDPHDEHAALVAEVIRWIENAYAPEDWHRAPPGVLPQSRVGKEDFIALARRVLGHQNRHNAAYARYARQLGVDLDNLPDPLTAPLVPTDGFKRQLLTAFDPTLAVARFRSSGTTRADRSSHWFRTLEVMRAAISTSFERYVLTGWSGDSACDIVVLAPTPRQAPSSSLYFMLGHVCWRYAAPGVRTHYFDDGGSDLDVRALCRRLEELCARERPVLLLGPSFAYVHLFERMPHWRVSLPVGSRLFETGGFKGKVRALPRSELHQLFAERLGIGAEMVIGEYGMSELSSQLYETSVRCSLLARKLVKRLYIPPPWCAVQVVDPVTLEPVAIGQEGLVSFFDLANVDSVCAVVTGDMGRLVGAHGETSEFVSGDVALSASSWHGLPAGALGVELLGRAPGATAKGCSLAIDMLLEAR